MFVNSIETELSSVNYTPLSPDGNACVYKGDNKTALKIIEDTDETRDNTFREIVLSSVVNSENLPEAKLHWVQFLRWGYAQKLHFKGGKNCEFIDDETILKYVLEFQLYESNLKNWIMSQKLSIIPEKTSRSIIFQLLWALYCANSRYGIAHHDIKPENIFVTKSDKKQIITYAIPTGVDSELDYFQVEYDIDDPIVCLADLGAARIEHPIYVHPKFGGSPTEGTGIFMGPDTEKKERSFRTDLFAIGITLSALGGNGRLKYSDTELYTYEKYLECPPFYKNKDSDYGYGTETTFTSNISTRMFIQAIGNNYDPLPKTTDKYPFFKDAPRALQDGLGPHGYMLLKDLLTQDLDQRIAFGVPNSDYGANTALFHPWFFSYYKGRVKTQAKLPDPKLITPQMHAKPLILGAGRFYTGDFSGITKEVELKFDTALKPSAVAQATPKPAPVPTLIPEKGQTLLKPAATTTVGTTKWSLERFNTLTVDEIEKLDKNDIMTITEDMINKFDNTNKIIALAKRLQPEITIQRKKDVAKKALIAAIQKYKSGLSGGSSGGGTGGGGTGGDDPNDSDTSDQDDQPSPGVAPATSTQDVTPAAAPKQQPSPAVAPAAVPATPKQQPSSAVTPAATPKQQQQQPSATDSEDDAKQMYLPKEKESVKKILTSDNDISLLFGAELDFTYSVDYENISDLGKIGLMHILLHLNLLEDDRPGRKNATQIMYDHIKNTTTKDGKFNLDTFNGNVITPIKKILDRKTLTYDKTFLELTSPIFKTAQNVEVVDNNNKAVLWTTYEKNDSGMLLPPVGMTPSNKRKQEDDLKWIIRVARVWGLFLAYVFNKVQGNNTKEIITITDLLYTTYEAIFKDTRNFENLFTKRMNLILKAKHNIQFVKSSIWDRAEQYVDAIPAVAAAYTNLELKNKTLMPIGANHIEQAEFDRRVSILETMLDRIDASGGNGTFSSTDIERVDFFTPFTTSWRHISGSIQEL